jgi:hypothetical protein
VGARKLSATHVQVEEMKWIIFGDDILNPYFINLFDFLAEFTLFPDEEEEEDD